MAILFDLDGTLVDTVYDIINATNALCRELGKPILEPELIKNNTSFGLDRLLKIILGPDFANTEQQILEQLKNRFRSFYKRSQFVNSKPFPGIEELLNNLCKHKFKIAIVTNKNLEFAKSILDKLDLSKKINCLVTADLVVNPKPSPEPVLLAIHKLQVEHSKCLFIGDAEQDIIAGRSAGVKTVAALFGYIGDKEIAKSWPADHFVEQPTEIWPLICSLYSDLNY